MTHPSYEFKCKIVYWMILFSIISWIAISFVEVILFSDKQSFDKYLCLYLSEITIIFLIYNTIDGCIHINILYIIQLHRLSLIPQYLRHFCCRLLKRIYITHKKKHALCFFFFHIYTANQHTRGCCLATLRCQLKWVGLIFTHKRYI